MPPKMARKNTAPPSKTPVKPNASILNFFTREPVEQSLFLPSRTASASTLVEPQPIPTDIWESGDAKRRKLSGGAGDKVAESSKDVVVDLTGECSPPPLEAGGAVPQVEVTEQIAKQSAVQSQKKRAMPFLDDSDSDSDSENESALPTKPVATSLSRDVSNAEEATPTKNTVDERADGDDIPLNSGDFEEFEGFEDDDEDAIPEEQLDEGQWLDRTRRIQEEHDDNFDDTGTVIKLEREDSEVVVIDQEQDVVSCPICSKTLRNMGEEAVARHVNDCLDLGDAVEQKPPDLETKAVGKTPAARFVRPPKPGQTQPVAPPKAASGSSGSAFSKLMTGNAEDTAWATAAAANDAARGKPAYQRTCPFYKIMPGLSICVDAFRYGAVEGCNAYFLSHFHSDHYIGLTSTWAHGPIYCSKVTGNLVRQQLRVDSKWVIPLEFEEEVEVPNTGGCKVTMISANHCPGSSLFLFEKRLPPSGKLQRILHCGDFRACRAHIEHPLLRPDVQDVISGKKRQQKLDICYLDTTYLNPKYAFPKQSLVIQACADLCMQMNASTPAETLESNNGAQMSSFVKKSPPKKSASKSFQPAINAPSATSRLLVVVGTYSIGKERVCIGIAHALKSKIFAPPAKMRIARALEDPELDALLTSDARAAQVHMTPLFEIRADTLQDYLATFGGHFTHVAGFRPTGWTYRPPGTRFIDNPPVASVLHGANWSADGYGVRDMAPQRGSTRTAKCFGVPYSEHSSFRELAMFCCALRIDKVVPTVNVGSAKSRERMRTWVERWNVEKRKNGLFDPKYF